MHKITFYTFCNDKPEWRYMRNEVWTNELAEVEVDHCDTSLASCAGVIRAILKTNMRLAFATFEPCDGAGQPNAPKKSFGTAFLSFNTQGERPQNAEMFYRDTLTFTSYPRTGRAGHSWWRGCLDADDVFADEQIGRGSRVAPTLSEKFRDSAAGYSCRVLQTAQIIQRGALVRCEYAATSHYTDSHAVTRQRRRVTGNVAVAGEVVFQSLEQMYRAIETCYYWQSIGSRITPARDWNLLVEAISVGVAVYKIVERASRAGSNSDDENATEPVQRFGIAWAAIIEAWAFASQQSQQPLQQLLASERPHIEGGDAYMNADQMEKYISLMAKILKQVSATANADWYNPNAYDGQMSEAQRKRVPDILELTF